MPLKPEVAEKRLDAWKTKNPEARVTARIRQLPKTLQSTAFGLLRKGPDGKAFKDWRHGHEALEAANLAMSKLTPAQRTKLFAAFFPNLADALAAAWALFDRLPYQMDGDRKAFRAPNNPAASAERKGDWFSDIRNVLEDYRDDVVTLPWCATWAAYLGYGGADELGILFAAALDAKLPEAEEVFQILVDSVTNRHEIGAMGRHVTRALLVSSRKDGWELMEKTLLAAQRQEGLRQSILETVDEAHPEAFRRMVKLVLDKDLLRFSSAARAVDVWFGLGWDMGTTAQFKKALKTLDELLNSAKARKAALASTDPETVYFALIVHAFEDAEATVPLAVKLLKHKSLEHRYVALRALEAIALPASVPALVTAFADADVKLALLAVSAILAMPDDMVNTAAPDLFDRLETLLQRMPEKQLPNETLVSWPVEYPARDDLADGLGSYLGKRSASRLTPYIGMMSPWRRRSQIEELAQAKPIAPAARALFFDFVTDRSDDVREAALKAISKCKPTPEEVRDLEPILTRKSESARRGVLSLIQKQKPAIVFETADRLLTSKNGSVRLGGLELLRFLSTKDKSAEPAKEKAAIFLESAGKRTADETRALDQILQEKRDEAGPHDAFGLCDLSTRTSAPKPVAKKVAFVTPAAIGILKALDDLIHEHRETPVKYNAWDGVKEELLGTIGYGFPSRDARKPIEKDAERLPLREVWENFWTNRPAALRDKDGFELIRALAVYRVDQWDWNRMREEAKSRPALKKQTASIFGDFKVLKRRYHFADDILEWLQAIHPVAGNVSDFLLDGLETIYAHLTADDLRESKKKPNRMSPELVDFWTNACERGPDLTPEQRKRRFFLDKWFDEPFPGLARDRVDLNAMLHARAAGWVTDTDLYDTLLGPRAVDEDDDDDEDENPLQNVRYGELDSFTSKSPPWDKKNAATFAPIAERIRARLLELELGRGEQPIPATAAVLCVDTLFGVDILAKLLNALAGKPLKRGAGYYWNRSLDRTSVLSHLIQHTHPNADDTPERFAELLRPIKDNGAEVRLLELAFLSPQWLPFVEHLLGWAGIAEGVWWFLAHMPRGQDGVEDDEEDEAEVEMDDEDETDDAEAKKPEKKSAWERLIAQRTPLTEEERAEGAVDVSWFHRTYQVVGAAHWAKLTAAAKFGGSGQDWKKPNQLAEVLLGKAKKSDLVNAIRVRKLKESVRLLGLLPITEGAGRDKDLKDRYEVLQEYARYARSLGSMSRAAAVRQGEIGLANLARTAGFPDPVRFEWAMEAESVADLAAGPQVVSVNGVSVTLSLDEGKPSVTVSKNGKPLKAIPPAVKKHEKIAELTARKQHLTRQASRVKKSLEAMMCRGDEFTGDELKTLMLHPILAPVLGRLVVIGEGIAGYPVEKGQALEDHAGKLEPVKPAERMRIAHSADLFATGVWDRWQHDCFARERVQPFKQVFRELYLLTDQEKSDGNVSHRYAGQQVQPRQGAALLNSRGWSTQDFTRPFHEAGIRVTFSVRHGGWTPLDVEGWTLEDIRFFRRDVWQPMPLAEVPPRIFSEAMRDLDLIVSVAHMGQIDPEASASTTEMRAALLRETTQLLRLGNVRVETKHVLIDGSLGQYSVHLGSGTVHRLPGGSVCIVPVHAQHRGRLFLPFADDDPRTAEIVSKVLLLARDGEIQDPGILQQLLNA